MYLAECVSVLWRSRLNFCRYNFIKSTDLATNVFLLANNQHPQPEDFLIDLDCAWSLVVSSAQFNGRCI
jgi:hypothetical protein